MPAGVLSDPFYLTTLCHAHGAPLGPAGTPPPGDCGTFSSDARWVVGVGSRSGLLHSPTAASPHSSLVVNLLLWLPAASLWYCWVPTVRLRRRSMATAGVACCDRVSVGVVRTPFMSAPLGSGRELVRRVSCLLRNAIASAERYLPFPSPRETSALPLTRSSDHPVPTWLSARRTLLLVVALVRGRPDQPLASCPAGDRLVVLRNLAGGRTDAPAEPLCARTRNVPALVHLVRRHLGIGRRHGRL